MDKHLLKRKVKIAVLLSGQGTTLQNLIDKIEEGKLDARIDVVIASRPDAYGLIRARNHGIAATCIYHKDYPDNKSFNDAIYREIAKYKIDLIVLAGFMHLLRIKKKFQNRVINIHPALLPSFGGKGMYGLHVHKAVLDYGCKVTGCTVHFVDEKYDTGPIILQAPVEIKEDDLPQTLASRVQAKERELLPQAIQLFAEGRIKVEGRKVKILPKK